MPALKPTDYYGEVVFLGHVTDRQQRLASKPLSEISVTFAGVESESHSGLTRAADSRVRFQYDLGTEIRNTRQLTIMSQEEVDIIAARMGVDSFDPCWVGASMVIRGIPDFTFVPPSSRLQFASGATLTVDMQNRPCVLPAKEIDRDRPGFGKAFKPAANDLRGVTAWVEREGRICIGDSVRLHIPDQTRWPQQRG